MAKFRRRSALVVAAVASAASIFLLGSAPANASEPPVIPDISDALVAFELADRVSHVAVFELEDGTEVEVGADPVPDSGLDGTWHVWGDNGFFRMEYYVTYQSVSGTSFTRTNGNPYGFKVVGRAGLTWDNGRLSTPRAVETASLPCLVEGEAQFHYPLVEQTGGVRASVKNGQFTASLW